MCSSLPIMNFLMYFCLLLLMAITFSLVKFIAAPESKSSLYSPVLVLARMDRSRPHTADILLIPRSLFVPIFLPVSFVMHPCFPLASFSLVVGSFDVHARLKTLSHVTLVCKMSCIATFITIHFYSVC